MTAHTHCDRKKKRVNYQRERKKGRKNSTERIYRMWISATIQNATAKDRFKKSTLHSNEKQVRLIFMWCVLWPTAALTINSLKWNLIWPFGASDYWNKLKKIKWHHTLATAYAFDCNKCSAEFVWLHSIVDSDRWNGTHASDQFDGLFYVLICIIIHAINFSFIK